MMKKNLSYWIRGGGLHFSRFKLPVVTLPEDCSCWFTNPKKRSYSWKGSTLKPSITTYAFWALPGLIRVMYYLYPRRGRTVAPAIGDGLYAVVSFDRNPVIKTWKDIFLCSFTEWEARPEDRKLVNRSEMWVWVMCWHFFILGTDETKAMETYNRVGGAFKQVKLLPRPSKCERPDKKEVITHG